MISAEKIESWRGQQVLDLDGEQLGKLDDVFFDTGSGTPLLISVKHGLLGRKSTLVPIDGAQVGPDYVRVAHHKAQVDNAGEMRGDAAPGAEELAALGSVYGLRFADRVNLQSASELEARRAEAEAARARADELESDAQQKLAAREDARQRHEAANAQAGQAEREAEEARQAALEARRHADTVGGEGGPPAAQD